ncbi:MAG: ASCH domain-containing protein [Treponemataceae bacterium]|nr:ASCH domain-containing protein [Treponemataceae bacterium]
MTAADSYWQQFLRATGRTDEKCAGDVQFSTDGFADDARLALILAGKKTAAFSPFATFAADNEPLPAAGELYLLFDRAGTPRCVIEIESVAVVPFDAVTWDMARQEGEATDLNDWHGSFSEFLQEESESVGFPFTPDTRLVFQTFRVIYV